MKCPVCGAVYRSGRGVGEGRGDAGTRGRGDEEQGCSTSAPFGSAQGKPLSVKGAEEVFNAQHSALSTQHSTLSTQHSALSTQHSTLSTQHSTLSTPLCRRCKADLSDLVRLYDQAIWYHRQALLLLAQGHYSEAAAYNDQAIALNYSNADFHALAGKLLALQGEFRQAIASWQQALKFDPQNAIACHCLQMIELR